MKAAEVKVPSGYQAIKAKTLQLPPEIIENKPSTRSGQNSEIFDVSTPSLFPLRFLASLHSSDQSKSRLSRGSITSYADVTSREDDKRLPPVELSINKKIKFPHNKKLTVERERNGFSQLISSDRVIIEELRQHLRTQPPNRTTSVLEAIGDPQIREERFYYEPLKSLVQDKEESGHRSTNDSRVPVVNIMIPENGRTHDTGIVLPLTIARHQAAATRNANRVSGGATSSFSYLPQVVGSSLEKRLNGEDTAKHLKDVYQINLQNLGILNLQIETNDTGHLTGAAHAQRKSQINLPRIAMKTDDIQAEETRYTARRKRRHLQYNDNAPPRAPATVHLPARREDKIAISSSFPRRATTTANGKAHLIGPMNKMEMIADYSKALQSGLITYNEYMKKLSVLSLHRVALPNSAQRQFHIVRDELHSMKPTLTHVDMKPITTSQSISFEQHSQTTVRRPNMPNDKVKEYRRGRSEFADGDGNVAGSWTARHLLSQDQHAQPRLHRIDIGEGLTLFDENKSPDNDHSTADLAMPDLTRYMHAHHPRPGRLTQYHWNHDFPGNEQDTQYSKANINWQRAVASKEKVYNHRLLSLQSSVTNTDQSNHTSEAAKAREKVLISLEDYLNPRSTSTRSKVQNKQKNKLRAIGEYESKVLASLNSDAVLPLRDTTNQVGKIPYTPSGNEKVGFDSNDVMRASNLKVPPTSLAGDTDLEDTSDVDSIFQPHLDNMLKTIKKAKANRKRKVPELRGLVPTVIPQLRVEKMNADNIGINNGKNMEKQETKDDHNQTTASLLEIKKSIPDNTPPPTARKYHNVLDNENNISPRETLAVPKISSYGSNSNLASNVKIIIDKNNSQVIVNRANSGPCSPASTNRRDSSLNQKIEAAIDDSVVSENNTEIRIMTASVDLGVTSDGVTSPNGETSDRSRLEVVITSMPVTPPASLATSSDGDSVDIEN